MARRNNETRGISKARGISEKTGVTSFKRMKTLRKRLKGGMREFSLGLRHKSKMGK